LKSEASFGNGSVLATNEPLFHRAQNTPSALLQLHRQQWCRRPGLGEYGKASEDVSWRELERVQSKLGWSPAPLVVMSLDVFLFHGAAVFVIVLDWSVVPAETSHGGGAQRRERRRKGGYRTRRARCWWSFYGSGVLKVSRPAGVGKGRIAVAPRYDGTPLSGVLAHHH